MKLKLTVSLLLALFVNQVYAIHFFAHDYEKQGKLYTNIISMLDVETGNVTQSIDLGFSYKRAAYKLNIPENPYMFFYTAQSKVKATIHIVKKDSFSLSKKVQIDPLNSFLKGTLFYEFYQLTDDHSQLIIHTGKKKNQHLVFINTESGEVINKIKLNRYKNKASLTDRQKYLLVEDLQKKEITVFSTKSHQPIQTFKLGKSKLFGEVFDDHLYLIKLYEKNNRKHYGIQAINLLTKQSKTLEYDSRELPVFQINSVKNQLLVAGTRFKGVKLMLHEVVGNELKQIGDTDFKFKPKNMKVDEAFNKLLIMGSGDVATIDLDSPDIYSVTDLPFDTVNSFYNSTGELLYLKEGSGSEVAVIDIKNGKLIERSGTGRKGVKFGQFMASVALAGVGANFGYFVYFAKYSNTGFTLNHQEDKLYVINSKTNDVTHLNAHDLSDRKAIATGGGTFLVHQGKATDAPLWVFSNKHINQINDSTFELVKEIAYESIIGFDMEEDYFIIRSENYIEKYDMSTGLITKQWPKSDANLIWSEQ